MIDTFLYEWTERNKEIQQLLIENKMQNGDFYQYAITQLELLQKADSQNVRYVSQLAEFYHLDGYLRKAGENYNKVLEMSPLSPITDKEKQYIYKFCPILLTNPKEPFLLKDIVAIHHPSQPIIGYHLFWEDDYDFPDDYEPCDHEEVWVEYDPNTECVSNVAAWFHSRIIDSEAAILEARENNQRPIIRIEWGKHGSLLCGWENMKERLTNKTLHQWLRETYVDVVKGGRVPSHPLKKYWPSGFEGSFEEYIDFSVEIDPLEWLNKKPYMFKSEWVNAVIFTQALHYNFHPKMEWPERFFRSLA